MTKVRLVQGNEACALGALKAGATFFAGYPITPSTEIAEHMAEMMPACGAHFVQMEDEIASIGAVVGAAATGAQGVHGYLRPWFLSYAGAGGICCFDRDSLCYCGCATDGSFHGTTNAIFAR